MADVADQSNMEGDSVSLQITATDWAASGGTWVIAGLPAGLNYNVSTGLISGVIASGTAENGPYAVTATYTDPLGNSNSTTFEWNVSDSLTLAYPGDQSGMEGDEVYLPMQASGYGSSGPGGLYAASGLPDGLNIDSATGMVYGFLDAGDADAGPYFVTVSYTNAQGDDAATDFVWNVGDPVTLADPGTQSVTEGQRRLRPSQQRFRSFADLQLFRLARRPDPQRHGPDLWDHPGRRRYGRRRLRRNLRLHHLGD